MVIDFEGEPARPYAARREKHTPLRDVAGMLRSFSYAAAAAGLATSRFAAGCSARPRGRVPPRMERGGPGHRACSRPATPTRGRMLDVLELEKTLYELRYELQLRPDWAHIPAEALA